VTEPALVPLSTMSSIIMLEIIDGEESKADEVDDNKQIEVDTPRHKRATEEIPILKKNTLCLIH